MNEEKQRQWLEVLARVARGMARRLVRKPMTSSFSASWLNENQQAIKDSLNAAADQPAGDCVILADYEKRLALRAKQSDLRVARRARQLRYQIFDALQESLHEPSSQLKDFQE